MSMGGLLVDFGQLLWDMVQRMNDTERMELKWRIARIFTPSAPISDSTLFAGRKKQIQAVLNTISQRGQHAALFGERGVGKTSLAKVIRDFMVKMEDFAIVSTNCDTTTNFKSIWTNILNEGIFRKTEVGMGFNPPTHSEESSLSKQLSKEPSPEEIRQILQRLDKPTLIIIDEFDRITDKKTKTRLADTIKTLSDHSVDSTLLLIGVADSLDHLMAEHRSIERALVQIHMPRMSIIELREIVTNGLAKLGMGIEASPLDRISALSHGLPHYSHLLALHAAQAAVDRDSTTIAQVDVTSAINSAITQAQQTIIHSYQEATRSARGNLYSQVLLACALAKTDEWGYFPAANVRSPLSLIMNKPYDIPAFAQHLKDFNSGKRGIVLQRTGFPRRYRFRFENPLMEPYVVMKGISQGFIKPDMLDVDDKAIAPAPSANDTPMLF
jgi:Cdc6-like AAA superfamily ATPase